MGTKIVSFNVNSVRARIENILDWLKHTKPDIVCLQELKCTEDNFPYQEIEDLGYNIAISGQKTYNGVAILSKFKIEEITKILPKIDDEIDEQARYIEAVISCNNKVLRVVSVYVPNGGGELLAGQHLLDTAKFQYKLKFFKRLKNHLKNLLEYDEMLFVGGDFNVGVEEIDVFDAKKLAGTVCFHLEERKLMRELLNIGFIDSFRALNPNLQDFSWFDYRAGAFENNHGMRIDYILCSPLAADQLKAAYIENKGVRDKIKPSDHCPVTVEIIKCP